MYFACIVDDFNAIVNETEKEIGKLLTINMLPYVLPLENALKGDKLILLIATSQHHCLSVNFTYKGTLDKVFNLINEAILESGCVA